jgi:hypothetical protein
VRLRSNTASRSSSYFQYALFLTLSQPSLLCAPKETPSPDRLSRHAALLADHEARGWRLLRVDVPGEDDEPLLAAYCLYCAERAFGASPRLTSDQSDSG